MDQLELVTGPIPADTYRYLRQACGLSAKTPEAAEKGLANSVFSVQVRHEYTTIGMGRIIGDGGCFCQIVDICVLPGYQDRGIGKRIMACLMEFVENELPESCYVSLIADGNASFLYEQFGFRDTLPQSKGMFWKKDS